MRRFGLIGKSLGHSFSPGYFEQKFQAEGIEDAQYDLFELPSIQSLSSLLQTPNLVGLNVTIPYKQEALSFVDQLDPEAAAVGAVNTLHVTAHGVAGYNTDIVGFRACLKPFLRAHHQRALILGTGGASAAVRYVLEQLGLQCVSVSRSPEGPNQVAYEELRAEAMTHFKLIVNTTPVGQFPDVSARPSLPYDGLERQHLLVDLIYNPEQTTFLAEGQRRGASTVNGLPMLHAQAEASWAIWNG